MEWRCRDSVQKWLTELACDPDIHAWILWRTTGQFGAGQIAHCALKAQLFSCIDTVVPAFIKHWPLWHLLIDLDHDSHPFEV